MLPTQMSKDPCQGHKPRKTPEPRRKPGIWEDPELTEQILKQWKKPQTDQD